MGFNLSDFKFLLSGIEGRTICTLGRLTLFISESNASRVAGKPIKLPRKAQLFAEDLLAPLGYEVTSMDASAYEGASIVHDLNKPIPPELSERFDIVWDGGTLEHVFDYPAALSNALRMVKIGGHFACQTPANNQCGHGFYQFSPELFYRVLVPANGFEIVRVYVVTRGKHYHVIDPAVIHGRVHLLDSKSAMLMVHARKVGPVPARLSIPQQSDYVDAWQEQNVDSSLKAKLRSRLSPSSIERISRILNWLRLKRAVFKWRTGSRVSNRSMYRPVMDWTLPTQDVFKS